MTNATHVAPSDTIRTLTEEELAVVSGGMSLAAQQAQARINAAANRFAHSSLRRYISSDPRVNALTFRTLNFWHY